MKISLSALAVLLIAGTTLIPMGGPGQEAHPGAEVAIAQPAIPQVAAQPPAQPPAQPAGEVRYSPFNAVEIANLDAIAIAALNSPELQLAYIRYLSLHNIPEANRAAAKTIIDRVLNGLNPTYRRIVRTAGLPAGNPAPIVLRVNLQDYNIRPEAWDFLAEKGSGQVPIPDPYFHEFITNAQVTAIVTPGATVTYGAGTQTGRCEIRATVLQDCAFFVGDRIIPGTGTTRTTTSPPLAAGKQTYDVRFSGTYNGTPYNLTQTINVAPGSLVQLVLAVPAAPSPNSAGRVYATASWLAIEPDIQAKGSTIANLVRLTSTRNPILRGDWFSIYSIWGQAYYQLIGLDLKDNPVEADRARTPKVYLLRDFERLLGFNFQEARGDIVAAVADTKLVTLHNRILQRFSTTRGITGGYYWRSKDSGNGINRQDYMANLETFEEPDFAVEEIIASGRNGLDFYGIADNQGRLLNFADAVIAHHSVQMPTRLRDIQIYNARNCMICHSGGMVPIQCRVRNLARGNIGLFITDITRRNGDLSRRIIEAFEPNLQPILDLDTAKYSAAVLAAAGKPGRAIGADLEQLTAAYYDQSVTLERMAWDAGISSDTLRTMLRAGVNLNYQLVGVLQAPEEAPAILPWESQGHAELMRYIISYQPRR